MSKSKFAKRYTPEFRRQMVALVRSGRSPSELSREFGCTSWSINRWVKQAERDLGRGDGGLTTVASFKSSPSRPSAYNIRGAPIIMALMIPISESRARIVTIWPLRCPKIRFIASPPAKFEAARLEIGKT